MCLKVTMRIQEKWEALSPKAKLQRRVAVTLLLIILYGVFCAVENKVENELGTITVESWECVKAWRTAINVSALLIQILLWLIWRKSDKEEIAIVIGKRWMLFSRIAATLMVVLFFIASLAVWPSEVLGIGLAFGGTVIIISIWSNA
jgi:hypothetical protein